jgi:crotonobetainyl-CoA:carnitine CoA-transferase CaiB-like acyl-CoA transferase
MPQDSADTAVTVVFDAVSLLEGVRVLDLGIWRPAPYAAQLLADLGADVVKIEPPGGDPMRAFPELFERLTRHKRCIELDLHDDGDRRRAVDLASDVDIAVEGFRPGVADRLGVGYDALRAANPSIVYCSISGYGQKGPRATMPGHDVNYQGYAGVLAPRASDVPTQPLVPYADLAAGLAAAMAMCAAYIRRLRTGEGEYVDVSMTDVLAHWNGGRDGTVIAGGDVAGRDVAGGDVDAVITGVPGYGVYATADGRWVSLGITSEDRFWSSLCEALGLQEQAATPFPERMRRHAQLDAAVTAALSRLSRDEAVERLDRAGVPVAPVLTRQEMVGALGASALVHPARYRHHPVL